MSWSLDVPLCVWCWRCSECVWGGCVACVRWYGCVECVVDVVCVGMWCMCYITCAVLAQSLSRAFLCNPMDCSPPGSSVHGIFQTRMVFHTFLQGIVLTQGSNPSPALQADSLPAEPQGKSPHPSFRIKMGNLAQVNKH